MSDYVLELRNITKTFGTLIANDHISLRIKRGSVHAIVGENGAGKSTLMNIITDILKADSGEIILNGEPVVFKNPTDAAAHGIGMIYQEFMLCNEFSVLDNIMLGFEETRAGFIDKKKIRSKVQEICDSYHFPLPLDALVKDLPVSVLQQVEIVKVLYRGAEIIIMDEPTSVLTPQGIEGLFSAIRFLVSKGKTVLFITHKLKEIFAIADYITVLRDGRAVADCIPSEITEAELCRMMVGRDVELEAEKLPCMPREAVLTVRNLYVKDDRGLLRVKGVDFEVRAGEIVGIAGVAGSGQRELVNALCGMTEPEKGGEIRLNGELINGKSVRDRMQKGMGYIPQDRMGSGCAKNMTLWENCIMGYHRCHGFKHRGIVNHAQATQFTKEVLQEFNVKASSVSSRAGELSGGNIQKMIVGREFSQQKRLYIIEDPTRGIDVGAIEFIWRKIIAMASEGAAILLVSHELNEVMQLSDRILVAYGGSLSDGGRNGELTAEQIGILMAGGENT